MSSNYYEKRVGQNPTGRGWPWLDEIVTDFTIRPNAYLWTVFCQVLCASYACERAPTRVDTVCVCERERERERHTHTEGASIEKR
jgi:hypothetical protein